MALAYLLTEDGFHLLLEDGSGAILLESSSPEPVAPNPYSPPVWQVKGSVDKVPMIPRKHYRNFR